VVRRAAGVILGRIGRMQRQQKITLGELRQSGPPRLLVYCGDYKRASIVMAAGQWNDVVRLSDLEPRFTCRVCGRRRYQAALRTRQYRSFLRVLRATAKVERAFADS
jgi:hypothetical protein